MRFLKTFLAALLVLAMVVFAVLQYRAYLRKSWKDAALARMGENMNSPNWVAKRISELKQAGPEDGETEEGWFRRDFVLAKNGEWMTFTNICRKEDWRIDDLFVGYGSDHQWYYSSDHFCIGAYVFRMHGQPDNLASMVARFRMKTFDGKSDACLESTR